MMKHAIDHARPWAWTAPVCILVLSLAACVTFKRTEDGYVKYAPQGKAVQETKPAPIDKPFEPAQPAEDSPAQKPDDSAKTIEPVKPAATPEPEKKKEIVEKDVKEGDPVIAPKKTVTSIPLITTLVPAPAPPADENAKRNASNSMASKGRESTAQNKFDMAEHQFEEAITIDPQNPYAYYFFAEERFLAGDYTQSATLCDRALALFLLPEWQSRAYLLRAKNMANMRYYQKAIEDCDKALQTDPANVGARLLQMKLYE